MTLLTRLIWEVVRDAQRPLTADEIRHATGAYPSEIRDAEIDGVIVRASGGYVIATS